MFMRPCSSHSFNHTYLARDQAADSHACRCIFVVDFETKGVFCQILRTMLQEEHAHLDLGDW